MSARQGDAGAAGEMAGKMRRPEPGAASKAVLPPLAGTLLGFDFGERRLGVAVGETGSGLAHPLATIAAEATEARFDAIARLVAEWRPTGFVVGLPRHRDAGEHAVARLAGKFARRLEARFGLRVAFVDETLTSAEAASRLRAAGARRGKGDLDAAAAALILQSYLDMSPPTAGEAHGHAAA